MNDVNTGSFVVLSDFHSNKWALEAVEKYLNEYDHIYILGDITDRGPLNDGSFGIECLLKLKEMCDLHKNIHYIPGNHDEFLYDAAVNDSFVAIMNLNLNNGWKTASDIEKLKYTNKEKFNEVFDFLGNLPLQMMHEKNGKKYALAHALFNQEVYDENSSFNLKDYYMHKNDNDVFNILWFRIKDKKYNSSTLPSSDITMVIGHTPQISLINQDLNLINADNEEVEVVCVDCGMENDGLLFKYDGQSSIEYFDVDTSFKEPIIEDDVKIYVRKK